MTDLERVTRQGMSLKNVKRQTEEICLAAVSQNGWALTFVKKQTPEICMIAVRKYGSILEIVKNQTLEIIMAALNTEDTLTYLYINQKIIPLTKSNKEARSKILQLKEKLFLNKKSNEDVKMYIKKQDIKEKMCEAFND